MGERCCGGGWTGSLCDVCVLVVKEVILTCDNDTIQTTFSILSVKWTKYEPYYVSVFGRIGDQKIQYIGLPVIIYMRQIESFCHPNNNKQHTHTTPLCFGTNRYGGCGVIYLFIYTYIQYSSYRNERIHHVVHSDNSYYGYSHNHHHHHHEYS